MQRVVIRMQEQSFGKNMPFVGKQIYCKCHKRVRQSLACSVLHWNHIIQKCQSGGDVYIILQTSPPILSLKNIVYIHENGRENLYHIL